TCRQSRPKLPWLGSLRSRRSVRSKTHWRIMCLIPNRCIFTTPAQLIENGSSGQPTNRANLLQAVWKPPCTRPGATRIGGAVGAWISRPSAGSRARRTRRRATPCSAILVGRPSQQGTGAIPKDAILELVPARGTPDLLDSIKVRHVSGGVSVIGLKSYQRGR